jgi:hypothetical protein
VLVVATMTTAMALWVKDRGSAVLVLGLAGSFALAGGHRALAAGVLVTGACAIGAWSLQLQTPRLPIDDQQAVESRVAEARAQCEVLRHQPRFCRASVLEVSDNADVFRALSLAQAGLAQSPQGFGLVDLPANGLSADRPADRLVEQMPEDYAPALFVATWGWLGLAALVVYLGAIASLGVGALRTLGLPREPMAHLLAAVGGFGLLADALRGLISLAGSLGALPLTGQPFVGLAYAPTANATFFLYLGLSLATLPAATELDEP